MDKNEYKLSSEIRRICDEKLATIRKKEIEIKQLEAEIEQIYTFINDIQFLGEIEKMRLDKIKENQQND